MAPAKPQDTDYEIRRQERIAANQALLRNLTKTAASTGLAPTSKKATPAKKKSKPAVKKEKPAEHDGPRRTSKRLQGLVADSETAKRKADEEQEAFVAAERAKRQRISGDLKMGDILVGGKDWDRSGNFLTVKGASPYERTFTEQDIKSTSNKELRALRERMQGLQLYEGWEPNSIKVTPERIYCMGFHPTEDKALVFAGDKLGNLGFFDANQTVPKVEDDEDEAIVPDPEITILKPHTRTICDFEFGKTDLSSVYTASYDSSVRRLDLNKGLAVEVWAPEDTSEDFPVSGVALPSSDPNMLYFTSLGGMFGIHDMRVSSTSSSGTQLLQLHDKKIGGFNIHPVHSHILATASLDRTMKVWDLRKISGKGEWRLPALLGEHESRLSVSHADFNAAGQVATSSYDDTVKIYDFNDCGSWKIAGSLNEERMQPATEVPHNNQTGRWVTILRPRWQMAPQDGVQRLVIGNMNRFVDIYAGDGQQLAQLGGDGITAVPAVSRFHPTQDWVCAGTASGKLCLWM